MDQRLELQVRPDENKKRLEDFLFDRFTGLSKLYLRELVKSEKCEVNGRLENRGFRLRANDFIELEIDPGRQNSMVPQDIAVDVVYEDSDLIIIDKPIGMLVHPSHRDKTGTVLNALTFYLNKNGDSSHIRPGLVHRLDKETSGLLVIAKNTRTHGGLGVQFEKKRVEKRYLALVDGIVSEDSGNIESRIGRYPEEKLWAIKEDGRMSETRFWVKERYTDKTLLELEPVTGRTNQLRIHCAQLGHPIVGDLLRGGSEYERLCLHAYRIVFNHPLTNKKIVAERAIRFA